MEYQKIINLSDDTTNKPSKFKTRNWVAIMMNHKEHIMKVMKLNLNFIGKITFM